jgi:sucrose-6F-phosphate phosphohydrolase
VDAHRVAVTSRYLLATDLDGTVLGDTHAVDRFRSWFAERQASWRLVYATGRSLASALQAAADAALPRPDAIISGAGTEIHDAAGHPWPDWFVRFDGWDARRVRDTLRRFRWLESQPDVNQTRLKASYAVRGLTSADLAVIRRTLTDSGLEALIVYSSSTDLDVLPPSAGKGRATRVLAERWGIPDERVLAFGDSGNDIELLSAGFRGTMVANALPELPGAVPSDVYRSPLRFADGILDGVRHWTTTIGPGRHRLGPIDRS